MHRTPAFVMVALAIAIPFLRDFFELATPTAEAVVAWGVGTTLGVLGMLGALRVARA